MDYISHEDFKKLTSKFQAKTPKGKLITESYVGEDKFKEGNAFTAGLAKTPKGGKFKVGSKTFKDETNYDDSSVEEGSYTDNYEGSWGYREGLNPDPMQATGQTINTVEGRDSSDNETGKILGSFGDEHGWFDNSNSEYKGNFDFDYDEEEFDDFESFMSKYGKKQNWFGRNDGKYFFNRYQQDSGGAPFRIRKVKGLEQEVKTEEGKEDDYITDPHKTNYSPKRFRLPKRTDTAKLDYDPNVSMYKPDYMDTVDSEDVDDSDYDDNNDDDLQVDDEEMYTKLPKNFKRYVAKDKEKYALREATAPMGLEVLSVSEREQLREYVKSVKTIQQEIKKLVSKAHEGKMGGDRTGMIMGVSEKEEKDDSKSMPARSSDDISYDEVKAKLSPELYDKSINVLSVLRKRLQADGELTPLEVEMFIKHEIKKRARKAIDAQHDPY